MQYKILTEYGMFNMKTKHKNEYVIKEKFCERFFEKYHTNPNYIQIVESIKGQLIEEDKLVYELVNSCENVTQVRDDYNYDFERAYINNVELKLGNGWPMLKINSSDDAKGKRGKAFITIFMPTSAGDEYIYNENDNSITLKRKSNIIGVAYAYARPRREFSSIRRYQEYAREDFIDPDTSKFVKRKIKEITFYNSKLNPQKIKEIISIINKNGEAQIPEEKEKEKNALEIMNFVSQNDIILDETGFNMVSENPQLLKIIENVKSSFKKKSDINNFFWNLYKSFDDETNKFAFHAFLVKAVKDGEFDDGSPYKKLAFNDSKDNLLKLYLTPKVKMENFTNFGYNILKVTYSQLKPTNYRRGSKTWYFLKK